MGTICCYLYSSFDARSWPRRKIVEVVSFTSAGLPQVKLSCGHEHYSVTGHLRKMAHCRRCAEDNVKMGIARWRKE